jgi:hypothetical protein
LKNIYQRKRDSDRRDTGPPEMSMIPFPPSRSRWMMSESKFYQAVRGQKEALVDALFKQLRRSSAPHYKRIKSEVLRDRCQKLVDHFLRSLKGVTASFTGYIEQMTEERLTEGYFLQEMQLALNILEARLWQLAVDQSNIAALVPNLSLITTIIGGAKDRLAQIYLEHTERAEDKIARLEKRCETLFKGTEGFVSPDDE